MEVLKKHVWMADVADATNILVIPRWNNRFQRGSYSNYYPIDADHQLAHDIKIVTVYLKTAVSDWFWGSQNWTSASRGRAMTTFRSWNPTVVDRS